LLGLERRWKGAGFTVAEVWSGGGAGLVVVGIVGKSVPDPLHSFRLLAVVMVC